MVPGIRIRVGCGHMGVNAPEQKVQLLGQIVIGLNETKTHATRGIAVGHSHHPAIEFHAPAKALGLQRDVDWGADGKQAIGSDEGAAARNIRGVGKK